MDESSSFEEKVRRITKNIQDIFNIVSDSSVTSYSNLFSYIKENELLKGMLYIFNTQNPTELDLAINAIYNIKIDNDDLILECFFKQKQLNINNITYYDSANRKICYMDYNMFVNLKNDTNFKKTIGIEDYVVPYSPAHIAEVFCNPKKDIFLEQDLNNISKKTDNIEILLDSKDSYHLVKEDIFSCYERTGDDSFDIILATNQKLLDDILFRLNEKQTEKNRVIYNNHPEDFFINYKEMVNRILNQKGLSYDLDTIKENGNCCDYNSLNDYIHNLYFVLDYFGVKKDNKFDKVCSSRFDIEHLLYASCSDLFLTMDERLRLRAKAIFSALGKNVLCPKVSKTFKVLYE